MPTESARTPRIAEWTRSSASPPPSRRSRRSAARSRPDRVRCAPSRPGIARASTGADRATLTSTRASSCCVTGLLVVRVGAAGRRDRASLPVSHRYTTRSWKRALRITSLDRTRARSRGRPRMRRYRAASHGRSTLGPSCQFCSSTVTARSWSPDSRQATISSCWSAERDDLARCISLMKATS